MGTEKCVICHSEASRMTPVAGFVGINCSQCGDYSINGQLLQDLEKGRRGFHVPRTRTWLALSRKSGGVPAITILDISIHDLLNPI